MDLQKKILEYAKYNMSFSMLNGKIVIKIEFMPGWSVPKPDDSLGIEVIPSDEIQDEYYYITRVENGFDNVIGIIDETIKFNIDNERKVIIFRQKVEELKELFCNETAERLATLRFSFPERAEKSIQKSQKVSQQKAKPKTDRKSENKKVEQPLPANDCAIEQKEEKKDIENVTAD